MSTKPVDAQAVHAAAARGLTLEQVAASVGVSVDTLARRRADTPAVAAALASGRAEAVKQVESVAFACALKADLDPRYQTSLIFWLKAMAGWKDRVTVSVETEASPDDYETFRERVLAAAGRSDG